MVKVWFSPHPRGASLMPPCLIWDPPGHPKINKNLNIPYMGCISATFDPVGLSFWCLQASTGAHFGACRLAWDIILVRG